ncbi:hypothetical protein Z517_07669 [Fonsecaea pedrosoi CBS 271.37]|uniref:Uncharacterized protein n=1 Tax=Fonsecaea pedrosoi CBS 271.37 TaxID=1442368 RepID=A0A0D2DJJ7_9EURO|nr:uncharacterized protein Z517_07669 [Fonsecaea pedrosoi CBS 271.37]KIW77836.1 hypothetical protein Z517_07669 [Fonsecaea pedrosoi CBS 271.37]
MMIRRRMDWEDYYTLLEDAIIRAAMLQRFADTTHVIVWPSLTGQQLGSRQSSPPLTTDPDCTLYDGYFYVTARNYTWQLQCSNTYDGVILAQTTDTTDLGSCIQECVNYNRQNTPGACLAVTFNGAFATADTVCTQFSDVISVGIASEEGARTRPIILWSAHRAAHRRPVTFLDHSKFNWNHHDKHTDIDNEFSTCEHIICDFHHHDHFY